MKEMKVEFDISNGLVAKKGTLLDFVVKKDITYGIISVGINLYEIELKNIKILIEKDS